MSADENKTAKRLYFDAFNSQNLDAIDELFAQGRLTTLPRVPRRKLRQTRAGPQFERLEIKSMKIRTCGGEVLFGLLSALLLMSPAPSVAVAPVQ